MTQEVKVIFSIMYCYSLGADLGIYKCDTWLLLPLFPLLYLKATYEEIQLCRYFVLLREASVNLQEEAQLLQYATNTEP